MCGFFLFFFVFFIVWGGLFSSIFYIFIHEFIKDMSLFDVVREIILRNYYFSNSQYNYFFLFFLLFNANII
jgi:hypothetical protein